MQAGGLGAFPEAGLSHEASLVGLVYVHPLSLESYEYEYSYGFLLSSKKELIFAAAMYAVFFNFFNFSSFLTKIYDEQNAAVNKLRLSLTSTTQHMLVELSLESCTKKNLRGFW